MTMVGDKLRYEVGMLSKATRTIQLSKVQDVTVRQSLPQRIAGVGDQPRMHSERAATSGSVER